MISYFILVIANDADQEFMTMLFQNYSRLMYHEIFQIVNDRWVTEDVMQEVLIKLIDKIEALRNKDRKRQINYIISASKNSARNYLRDHRRYIEISFEEQSGLADSLFCRDEIEDQLILQCDLDGLVRIWPKLDERSRYLLEGYYILKKTISEIAGDLGVKPNSVRMALTRARRTAYRLLVQELDARV